LNERRHAALRALFHVPNGEYRPIHVAVRLKRMLVRAGVFDFILLWPSACGKYSGLILELKAKTNPRASKQQIEFGQAVHPLYRKVIAIGAYDAIRVIKEHLGI
jgi:hypothetical protein